MDDSRHASKPEGEAVQAADLSSPSLRQLERASLKSLRDHVSKAVEEIVRLRAQNKSLARRLAEFEAAGGGSGLILEEGIDVQELRSRISSFITTIDAYLSTSDEG